MAEIIGAAVAIFAAGVFAGWLGANRSWERWTQRNFMPGSGPEVVLPLQRKPDGTLRV